MDDVTEAHSWGSGKHILHRHKHWLWYGYIDPVVSWIALSAVATFILGLSAVSFLGGIAFTLFMLRNFIG